MNDVIRTSNYSNVHELVSDLVACALIEGARPTSFSASIETKRVKQLLLDEIEDRSRELRKFKAHGNETGALPHASAALKTFMSELGEIMSMDDGATPADYLQRARDIREWFHDHQTCDACLEAQSLITDFDSEIADGDVPDRLGDLLPKLRSAADAVGMVRTATLLHKRNCECEACYWIGRSPLAQQQANAKKALEGQS